MIPATHNMCQLMATRDGRARTRRRPYIPIKRHAYVGGALLSYAARNSGISPSSSTECTTHNAKVSPN